jgi:hypothetical protein
MFRGWNRKQLEGLAHGRDVGVQRDSQDIIYASRAQHQDVTGKGFWIMMNFSIPRGAYGCIQMLCKRP